MNAFHAGFGREASRNFGFSSREDHHRDGPDRAGAANGRPMARAETELADQMIGTPDLAFFEVEDILCWMRARPKGMR